MNIPGLPEENPTVISEIDPFGTADTYLPSGELT